MDPYGDFGRYLAGIDWAAVLAALAAAIVVGGLVLALGIAVGERFAEDVPGLPPRLARALGRLGRLGRPEREPRTRWLCGTCHSWNPPGSSLCAAGCGPRNEREEMVPPVPADELGRQRGGRGTRRG